MAKVSNKPTGPLAGLSGAEIRERLATDLAAFVKGGGKVREFPMGETSSKRAFVLSRDKDRRVT